MKLPFISRKQHEREILVLRLRVEYLTSQLALADQQNKNLNIALRLARGKPKAFQK